MAEKKYYYLDVSRKPIGPFSLPELSILSNQGKITNETLVAQEGDVDWAPWKALAPPPAQQSSVDKYYYLNEARQPTGPMSLSRLSILFQNGVIQLDTLIAKEGGAEWVAWRNIKSLPTKPLPPLRMSSVKHDDQEKISASQKTSSFGKVVAIAVLFSILICFFILAAKSNAPLTDAKSNMALTEASLMGKWDCRYTHDIDYQGQLKERKKILVGFKPGKVIAEIFESTDKSNDTLTTGSVGKYEINDNKIMWYTSESMIAMNGVNVPVVGDEIKTKNEFIVNKFYGNTIEYEAYSDGKWMNTFTCTKR